MDSPILRAKQDGIRLGLRAAASYLESEADDCNAGANRTQYELGPIGSRHPHDPEIPRGIARMNELTERAKLLRKLAAEVRDLKVSEGRRS